MPFSGYALIIAVGHYPNLPADKQLPLTIADADAIYALLTDPSKGAYSRENVTLLKDAEATKDKIMASLAELAQQADSKSNIFVYFSGHGSRRAVPGSSEQSSYLLPYDANLSDIHNTCVRSTDFEAALAKIAAKRKIVFFDACKSGGMQAGAFQTTNEQLDDQTKIGMSEKDYQGFASEGQVVFASSYQGEKSYILPNDKNSLFTVCLLEILGGNVTGDEPYILVSDLLAYLCNQVPQRAKKANQSQHPYFRAEGDNFAVFVGNASTAKDIDPADAVTARKSPFPIASVAGESSSQGTSGAAAQIIQAGRDAFIISGNNITTRVNNSTNTTNTTNTGGGANIGGSGNSFNSGGGAQNFGGTPTDLRNSSGPVSTGSGSANDNRGQFNIGSITAGNMVAGNNNTISGGLHATPPPAAVSLSIPALQQLLARSLSADETSLLVGYLQSEPQAANLDEAVLGSNQLLKLLNLAQFCQRKKLLGKLVEYADLAHPTAFGSQQAAYTEWAALQDAQH